MLKILQISDTLKNVGGAEKVMHNLKYILEKNGHAVSLWGSQDTIINQSIKSIFNLRYYFELKKYLVNKEFDIVHIHKFNSILSPSIFLAIKGRVVLHVHDFSFYCPKLGVDKYGNECRGGLFHPNCNRPIERNFIGNALYDFFKWIRFILNRYFIKKYVNIFLCPSKRLQDAMIKSLNLPKERVIYLPNFIEIEDNFSPNFNQINDKKLLFVGRLSKEKGVDIAIKAFNLLIKEKGITDIILEIVGDGPDKTRLEDLVKLLGIKNNIRFLGKIDNVRLKGYYESSIGLIMPSIWLENNPLVAIEGMKFGKPIIGSNIGGYPDLIENGKNGFLFTLGNYEELAENIKVLWENKELSIRIGEYGFNKITKEFNSSLFYKKLLETYKVKILQ